MARGNIISVKQLIRDAKGAEKFMPKDIAFDELERLATLGLHFERIQRAPACFELLKSATGRWRVNNQWIGSDLIKALNKAGL